MSEKQKKFVSATAVVSFLLVMILVGWYVGVPMIRMANEPEAFRLWVDSHGIWGRILFIGIVVFQVIVAFVPGEPIELAAGYIFGVLEGTLLTMVGFVIGSWLIFLLVRRFGAKLVEVFFPKEKIESFHFLKNPKRTRVLVFVLMTIPGTPKDFLSYFAGLTPITLREWLFIVVVARFFSLITSTVTGAAAGEKNYFLSILMLAITALISIAGIWYYRRLYRQEQEANQKHLNTLPKSDTEDSN